MSDNIWIFAAFGCYLLVMIVIGLVCYKRTKSTEDYFLGGRSLGGWVAALSAQASDIDVYKRQKGQCGGDGANQSSSNGSAEDRSRLCCRQSGV